MTKLLCGNSELQLKQVRKSSNRSEQPPTLTGACSPVQLKVYDDYISKLIDENIEYYFTWKHLLYWYSIGKAFEFMSQCQFE